MDYEKQRIQFIEEGGKEYLNNNTISCVIFGYYKKRLKVLIGKHRFMDIEGLPGGFIQKAEPIGNAAIRILKERTSIENIFLQQFHIFGEGENARISDLGEGYFGKSFISMHGKNNWLSGRIITIGYYAQIGRAHV